MGRKILALTTGVFWTLWLLGAPGDTRPQASQDPTGGMGLGGSAQTTLLAHARVDALPGGPLVWLVHEVLQAGSSTSHRHGPSFAYAIDGTHTLTLERRTSRLQPGQAAFIGQSAPHTHGGHGRIWEMRLGAPGEKTPPDPSVKLVLETGVLQGIPRPPVAALFILVDLAPGGETSVHTHPGPEFIVVTKGQIVYQTALTGIQLMRVGQWHAIPPGTAVQKRNRGTDPAAFLSLFLLDPDRPFSAPGQF